MTSPTTDRRLGLTGGTPIKAPVKVATTANITLSGTQTIDGQSVASGEDVLVKDQTDTTANGLYIADSGTWTRRYDFDGTGDCVQGTMVYVINGSSNGNKFFQVTTADPITIGTSSLAFSAVSVALTSPSVGSITTTMLASHAVSYAKMQQASAGNVVLANATAAIADYAELAVAQNTLVGRGATGNLAALSIGTGLSFSGTTLNSASTIARSYLAGLTMSTAGSSATITIAAGSCADSTNAQYMTLAASISKTTASWVVGSAAGGLDTGAIATSTWYHFYVITRTDTNVVDVIFSASASAPALPTGYTLYRRIGSMFTNGSSQWTSFIQDGDLFQLLVPSSPLSTTNPGTSAVLVSMVAPLGLSVVAWFSAYVNNGTTSNIAVLFSDPATTDSTPDLTSLYSIVCGPTAALATSGGSDFFVRTSTAQKVRYRLSASGASDVIRATCKGYIDTRGRNA